MDLGSLKDNLGNQNYPIPEGVDVGDQGSVVICGMLFHVIFSVASLVEDAKREPSVGMGLGRHVAVGRK